MIYRLSDPKNYYTQRNNNDDGWTQENDIENNKGDQNSACNVTSIINAAIGVAGYPEEFFPTKWKGYDFTALKQPENRFHEILSTKEAHNYADEYCGRSASPPYYFPKCLAWALNEIKPNTARLLWLKTPQIVKFLEGRNGIVVLGRFKTITGKLLYHYVSLSGFEKDTDGNIVGYLIDDSWGNHETGYDNKKGDDTYLSIKKFNDDIADWESQSKMVILISHYSG